MKILNLYELTKRFFSLILIIFSLCLLFSDEVSATENLKTEVKRINISKSSIAKENIYLRIFEDLKTKSLDTLDPPASWPKPAEACFGTLEHSQCFSLAAKVSQSVYADFAFFENINVARVSGEDIYEIEASQPTFSNQLKSAFLYKRFNNSRFQEIGPAFFVRIDGGYKLFPETEKLPSLFVIAEPKNKDLPSKIIGNIYSLDIYVYSKKNQKFVYAKQIDTTFEYISSGQLAEEDIGQRVIKSEFQQIKSAVENWLLLQPEKE